MRKIKVERNHEEKKKQLMKLAGILKGTSLDHDDLWKDALKKNSRKEDIDLNLRKYRKGL